MANTRSAWSIANARTITGYEPQDDSEAVYAGEIRELMLGPARSSLDAPSSNAQRDGPARVAPPGVEVEGLC